MTDTVAPRFRFLGMFSVELPRASIPARTISQNESTKEHTLYVAPISPEDTLALAPDSVRAQTLLKIHDVPHRINSSWQTLQSPDLHLPFLVTADGRCLSQSALYTELARSGTIVESKDTIQTKTQTEVNPDVFAFVKFIDDKLKFAFLREQFVDDDVFDATISYSYEQAQTVPSAPLGWLLPAEDRAEIRRYLVARRSEWSFQDLRIETENCLKTLSEQLDTNKYLFGDIPTEADAALYSYLHIILARFPRGNWLRRAVIHHSNLISFAQNMYRTYFEDTLQSSSS